MNLPAQISFLHAKFKSRVHKYIFQPQRDRRSRVRAGLQGEERGHPRLCLVLQRRGPLLHRRRGRSVWGHAGQKDAQGKKGGALWPGLGCNEEMVLA